MAIYRARLTFDQGTGDTADRVCWGFGYSTSAAAATLLDDFLDNWDAAFALPTSVATTLGQVLPSALEPLFGEVFAATGGPALAVEDWGTRGDIATGGTSAPAELQVVVTHLIETARGNSARGRNYIGPLSLAQVTGPRVPGSLRDVIGESFRAHVSLMAADGHTFGTIKYTGEDFYPVVGHRVDDAWDIQRRRGWGATVQEEYL